MNKILIDAFGGDNSPDEIIEGTLLALGKKNGFTAVLVGDEETIKSKLVGKDFDKERVEILHAKDIITCEEEPVKAVMEKPDSGICVAFKTLKSDEEAKAFVSAGSTGAVLVGATLRLGRIPGVNRPALCPALPTAIECKSVFLLDSGANADCKSINLCQFAVMGSVYAEIAGVKNPKVALLSNGTEDEKGNALIHETLPLLKEMKGINFIGNIEARDILTGVADVVVTDGFSGNVALKSMESTVNLLFSELKKTFYGSVKGKIAGLLLKSGLKEMKNKLDYNKRGGALFLGAAKPVVKAHGSSKREAFSIAVLQAAEYAEKDITSKIKERLSEALS